jgi:hypothetical protein
LLTYLSRLEVRAVITQETNKAEAYHAFCAWVAFGGDRLQGGIDAESYEKRVKYTDLLANALILHTVVDMSVALERLGARGYQVTPEAVRALSPYTTRNWKRFGEYAINVAAVPPPLTTLTRLFQIRFGDLVTRPGSAGGADPSHT